MLEPIERHDIVPVIPEVPDFEKARADVIKITGNGITTEVPETVYIVCGYTDMRRSIDGLAAIVQQNFGLEPCSGSLFLFCGRKRDRLKASLWEDDGFLLMYKRLVFYLKFH